MHVCVFIPTRVALGKSNYDLHDYSFACGSVWV
jgi:hypothetical protein